MAGVAGAVGVLVVGLGVLGLFLTGFGHQLPAALSDQPWTAWLRLVVDVAAIVMLIVAGLALRWRPKLAAWPLGAVLALTAGKVVYDYFANDQDAARLQSMVRADLTLAVVVAVALFAHLVACDEEIARVELGPPRAPGAPGTPGE